MNNNWRYDYLVSCPSIILLGEFKYRNTYGCVLLTIAYPRVNITGRSGELVVLSKTPVYFLGSIVEKICMCISRGEICLNNSFLEKAIYKTMYYGGYVVYINIDGEAVPLTIELVNTDKYRFYYKHVEGIKQIDTSLENWIILGMSLRTGYDEYLWNICRDIGFVSEKKCFIKTHMGELVIATSILETGDYYRIAPDNSPLRHVIKYKK